MVIIGITKRHQSRSWRMTMIMAAATASRAFDNGSRGTATASVQGLSHGGQPNHHGCPRIPQRGSPHTQHIDPLSSLRFPLRAYGGRGRVLAQGKDMHRITQNLSYPVYLLLFYLFIFYSFSARNFSVLSYFILFLNLLYIIFIF